MSRSHPGAPAVRPRAAGRTVHAITARGSEIVRDPRTGQWYREADSGRHPISIATAVRLATEPDAQAYLDQPGGRRFDKKVRAQAAKEPTR